jgi:hypothetical protein
MKRKTIGITVLISIIIISSVSITIVFTSGSKYNYNFEEDFEGWIGDADNHVGENDSVIVDWNVTRTTTEVYEGDYSVALEIDGFQDDGGVWIERKYELDKVKNVKVVISFYIFCDNIGMNSRALIFASANKTNPSVEEDFDQKITTLSSDSYLEGWYRFKIAYNLKNTDTIWVAIGIKVAWETLLCFYIDNVLVKII